MFGRGKIEDFTWKGMLDFATCTECGRCQSQCPAWNTGKPLSPKLLIMDLRDHWMAKAPYLLGQKEAPTGEVDLAASEHRILGRIFEIDWLAFEFHRQQRSQPVGQPLEGDADRRQEDMQVLGVQHDDQEGQHHRDVQQQRDGFDGFVGRAQRFHDPAEEVRQVRPVAVGQGPVVGRRPAQPAIGPHHVENHHQDQPGAAVV